MRILTAEELDSAMNELVEQRPRDQRLLDSKQLSDLLLSRVVLSMVASITEVAEEESDPVHLHANILASVHLALELGYQIAVQDGLKSAAGIKQTAVQL